jgi:hypothetical protein
MLAGSARPARWARVAPASNFQSGGETTALLVDRRRARRPRDRPRSFVVLSRRSNRPHLRIPPEWWTHQLLERGLDQRRANVLVHGAMQQVPVKEAGDGGCSRRRVVRRLIGAVDARRGRPL